MRSGVANLNIQTMDHKFLENPSSAAVNTLWNTIIYLKAVKCLNIRQTDQLNRSGTKDVM